MEDSWIDMGSASAYGSNSFLNNGKVFVREGISSDGQATTSRFTGKEE